MRGFFFLLFSIVLFVVLLVLSRSLSNAHAVLSAPEGTVMFASDFSSLLEDWQIYDDGQLAAEAENGQLVLTVGPENRSPYSLTPYYVSDFDLHARAQAVGGPVNNGFGLIFRALIADDRPVGSWEALFGQQMDQFLSGPPPVTGYYLFLISSDGYYRVTRRLNGVEKIMSNWIPSEVIQQGLNASNDLRVVANGSRFAFYVNDTRMPLCIPNDPNAESTFTDFTMECFEGQMLPTLVDDALPVGKFGVIAQTLNEPDVQIAFDDVLVLGPAPVLDEE